MLLILHIPLHREFVQTHRGDEVASFPKSPRRELLRLFLDPCRGFTLDERNGIGYGVLRWHGDVEMDMLVSDVPGPDLESLPSTDQLEYSLEFLFNVIISQYLSAILGRPNHMVVADPGAMAELVQSSVGHMLNHRTLGSESLGVR